MLSLADTVLGPEWLAKQLALLAPTDLSRIQGSSHRVRIRKGMSSEEILGSM